MFSARKLKLGREIQFIGINFSVTFKIISYNGLSAIRFFYFLHFKPKVMKLESLMSNQLFDLKIQTSLSINKHFTIFSTHVLWVSKKKC